jgi:16S rRNA (guanine1207-N2)-methyltransferase
MLDKAAKPNASAASLQAWDAADELLLQQATHWMESKWLAGKQQADKPHLSITQLD